MLNVRLAGDHLYGKYVCGSAFFVLSFFPLDVLDEILNLIESVSEGFPSYFYINIYVYALFLLYLSIQGRVS